MYEFTKECMIGVEEIDGEHKRLFELLNAAMELLPGDDWSVAAFKSLLHQLKDYAATHFAHEEAYMVKINDPELIRQKKEHAAFVEKIESYDMAALGQSDNDGKEEAGELLNYLAHWLYRHILGSDIMIGQFTHKETNADAFAFTEKYITGIELIDEEHKRLLEIIRETNDLIYAELLHDKYDELMRILQELREYTIKHFADEEEYMERIGYEGLELQKAAHISFVDKLNEINIMDMDDNQQEYLNDLITFLSSWLINHIMKMDKQIPVRNDKK